MANPEHDDRDEVSEDGSVELARGRAYPAAGITVYFNTQRCQHTGVCLRGLPLVFDVNRRPWIRSDLGTPANIAAQIDRCPSGALSYELHAPESRS